MAGYDPAQPARSLTVALQVYAVRMSPDTAAERLRIGRWSAVVSEERRARAARFRRWEDVWRSYAGEMLVRYALAVHYGLPPARIAFERESGGKPRLREGVIGFNISHAGTVAAAVFGAGQVGIDVEQIGEADLETALAMFAPDEYTQLIGTDSDERNRFFYALWTAKESYVKALGLGLAKPLDAFAMRLLGGEAAVQDDEDPAAAKRWRIRRYNAGAGYCLTVCAERQRFAADIIWIDPAALTDVYKVPSF